MTLEQHNAFVFHLCCDALPDLSTEALEKALPSASAKHWQSLPATRQNLYRNMIAANVYDALTYVFQETERFLGRDFFEPAVRRFLAQHKIQTRHYHHIAHEFWLWAKETHAFDLANHPVLFALAEFEHARWELYQKPNQEYALQSSLELSLELAKLVFNPDLVLMNCHWPVHASRAYQNITELQNAKGETPVLLYRHPQNRVVEVFALNLSSLNFLEVALVFPDKTFAEICTMLQAQKVWQTEEWQEAILFLQQLLTHQIVLRLV